MTADEVVIDTDLYDDEVVKIERVVKALNNTRLTKATTVEGWRNEITQRFEAAGFRVSVVLRQIEAKERNGRSEKVDQILTSITVDGRVEDFAVGQYDHDRQGHHVRKGAGRVSGSGLILPD